MTMSNNAGTKTAIAVIDLHKHSRGGHFGVWHVWFATEFAKRFDQVFVVSSEPAGLEAFFRSIVPEVAANISFHRTPAGIKRAFRLERLRELPVAPNAKLSAFFMWAYDLPALQIRRRLLRAFAERLVRLFSVRGLWPRPKLPWATFTGISRHLRGATDDAAGIERRLLDILVSTDSCKAFLYLDGYVGKDLPKAHWIPDIENVELPPAPTALADRIRAHAGDRFCIGTIGILRGDRCLDEILPLALKRPEIRFVLAGRILKPTVRPELLPLLEEGRPPNLLVVPGIIDTEQEFNAAINATDAIFVDGSRYPDHSGVVTKALHFGKYVITPDSNSWTSDLIREWGVGMNYASTDADFVESWRKWQQDGGPARSAKASNKLRDLEAVARCFDAVAERLITT